MLAERKTNIIYMAKSLHPTKTFHRGPGTSARVIESGKINFDGSRVGGVCADSRTVYVQTEQQCAESTTPHSLRG
jgi:hypothetical protein